MPKKPKKVRLPDSATKVGDAPHMPVTDWWRRAVRAELKRRRVPQHELARAVGGGQSGISALLEEGGIPKSKYVRPVCEVLQIPPPVVTATTEKQARISELLDKLGQLDPEMFEIKASAMIQMLIADVAARKDKPK